MQVPALLLFNVLQTISAMQSLLFFCSLISYCAFSHSLYTYLFDLPFFFQEWRNRNCYVGKYMPKSKSIVIDLDNIFLSPPPLTNALTGKAIMRKPPLFGAKIWRYFYYLTS